MLETQATSQLDGTALIPYSYANRHRILVLQNAKTGAATLYYPTLPASFLVNEIQRNFPGELHFQLITDQAFRENLVRIYQDKSAADLGNIAAMPAQEQSLDELIPDVNDILDQDNDAPIIKLLSGLLTEAIRIQASDIHIATSEDAVVVKFRVDGVLREITRLDRRLAPMVISRAKVMAKLDIAEKRIPQDGRIAIQLGEREIDLRVSTMPAQHSERIVMRILDKQIGFLSLEKLGLSEANHQRLKQALSQPHGIVLVTGPTGSGKSTTLYAGLSSINDGAKNILTIEDPIEYQLDGIGQTQVNTKAGMTFAKGLRSMLRQDPDVIMVGEIRDEETLRVAVQASMTGHLVLSTLHTNTAIGAITRLIDMGVEPYLISSTLTAVVAQRLVRRLCPHCKQPHQPDQSELKALDTLTIGRESTLYTANPNGCPSCDHQGYKGRTAIYEVITISDAMRQMIHDRQPEAALLAEARHSSESIYADGLLKVSEGLTSFDEVGRVTASNHKSKTYPANDV